MALFLDSLKPEDIQRAKLLGFIDGITTNPTSLAQTGQPSLTFLEALTETFDGQIFYHLTASTLEGRIDEAWQAYELRPDRVVIKIPTTTDNLTMLPKLSGVEIAMTAIFSPAQAYLAAAAGAHYVIPYIGLTRQMLGNPVELVRDITTILAKTETEIIAANITSVEESIGVICAGAQHLTLPLTIIEAMGNHELTLRTLESYQTL